MMRFLDLAKERSSCRRYSSKPVSRESIERCLEAARLAPSACNSQPWRFIVVKDGPIRRELAAKAFHGIFGMNAFAKQAPVLVPVIRENSAYPAMLGAAFGGTRYSLIDVGIACEHFVRRPGKRGWGRAGWDGLMSERLKKY